MWSPNKAARQCLTKHCLLVFLLLLDEYGQARLPWFFMMPAYWRRPRARYLEEVRLWEHGQYGVNETPTVTMDTDKMEAVPPEFRNRNMLRYA